MRLGDLDRLKEVLERNFGYTSGAAVMHQLLDNAPPSTPSVPPVGATAESANSPFHRITANKP